MADEMKELKSLLRSLVVSSPTQVDVRTLLRDYRNMVGAPVPLAKYGHKDPVTFLKERCSDSFLLTGPPSNPILTLIVPDSLKHIDQFVQRQKVPSTAKFKSKRRSIPEAIIGNPPKQDVIYKSVVKYTPPIIEEPRDLKVKAPDIANNTNQNKENFDNHKNTVTSNDVKNFLKKRLPLYNSFYNLEEASSERDATLSLSQDNDSGKHTLSSSNSTKGLQFEELKSEIMELITAAPEGVWCTDLIRLYRERFNRELNFTRFGYTSIISLAYVLEQRVQITRPVDTGDWLLRERRHAAAAPSEPRVRRALAVTPRLPAQRADPDDALPGIQFDPDVFPEDCVRFMEEIPAMSLADCRPGAMLEVMVGEVYSPSHFWIIRLGENYNIAMEEMMDEMTRYYNGEGRQRVLARGAIRVGHYCTTLYENDWHRSVIVKIVDSDTVKVRHVDYGTVESVCCSALRALRREWARLPAQAVRARLAGVRPSAAGRRWPHAAAAHFLRAVRDARLVANVVALDAQHDVIETLLIDTRGATDLCLSAELIRAGHADARADSALRTAECYLYPRFEALESGDTPNLAEIHAYLRDGIALDYVEAYRLHVPMCLPALTPARPAAPPTASIPDSSESAVTMPDSSEPAVTMPDSPEPDFTIPDSSEPAVTMPDSSEPAATVPDSPELSELATRIPLLWPGTSPTAPEALSPTLDNSPSIASSPRSCPSPPPAHTPPASEAKQVPMMPSQDSRPPAVSVKPSVHPQPASNPRLAVHLEPAYNPQPCVQPQPVFNRQLCVHPQPAFNRQPGGYPQPALNRQQSAHPERGVHPQQGVHPQRAVHPQVGVHTGALYPLPPGLPPPPGGLQGGQWFGPYPAPGMVSLSLAECDTYRMLARVNPEAAHWYMAGALGRAMGAPHGLPHGPAHGPMHGPMHGPTHGPVRAPPGFGT